MEEVQFEFNSFLLQISKELTDRQFQHLKFVLKGSVTSAKCEEMTEVCHYFGELQRLLLLTPTDFGVLKKALNVIERPDLAAKCQEKESYFGDLLRPQIKVGDNLEQREYDEVCDGLHVAKAVGNVTSLPRSGQNTPDLQKQLKLACNENEDDIQISLPQFTDALSNGDLLTAVPTHGKQKEDHSVLPVDPPEAQMGTTSASVAYPQTDKVKSGMANYMGESNESEDVMSADEVIPLAAPMSRPQTDKIKHSGMASDMAGSNDSEDAMAVDELVSGAMAANSELISFESGQKGPSEHTGADGKNSEKTPLKFKMADASIGATIISSHLKQDDDVVMDGEVEEGESKKAPADEKTTNKGAEHQGQQNDYGGARPKTTPAISPGPSETTTAKAMEQTDEVAETVPHGTVVEEKKSAGYGTFEPAESTKVPTEDEYHSAASPTGDVSSSFTMETEPSEKKAKSTDSCSGQGAGVNYADHKNEQPSGVTGGKQYKGFSDQDAFGSAGHGLGYSTPPSGSTTPQQNKPDTSQEQGASGYASHGLGFGAAPFGSATSQQSMSPDPQYLMGMLQQFLALQQLHPGLGSCGDPGLAGLFANTVPSGHAPMFSSGDATTADAPIRLKSYNKGGYEVLISKGTLCQSSDEKGVVMMDSGTKFHIAIANSNDYNAEVDITFGGMYLGVWLVEAKRPLSNPLIIQGSSWATGRLTFFSASDTRRPEPNIEFGEQPQFNGIIELEFKPEILMLKLIVQHVWKEGTTEIFMPDYKTATVSDLKREINKKLSCGVSCLIMSGNVLQEDKPMSSYALENRDEVIQVLYMTEELSIESPGLQNPLTMKVDPFNVSVQDVKDYIEQKLNIQVDEQQLRLTDGQDVKDTDSITDLLVKSRKKPVLKVIKDNIINIIVRCDPSGSEHKVEINLFATVNELKQKIQQRGICSTIDKLLFSGKEISEEGSKQLYDLKFRNKSEVIVQAKEQRESRSTHRGFSAEAFKGGSRTRGFGSGRTRGFGDDFDRGGTSSYRGGGTSVFSTLRGDPEDRLQHDSMEHRAFGKEGIAMLCGNEESVFKDFEEDRGESKFSKEKAVTLIIQLTEKSVGASSHYSEEPSGPMSTKYPPPVPE